MRLELVYPSKNLKEQIIDFRNEFYQNNEMHIPGGAKLDIIENIYEWIKYVQDLEKGMTSDGFVSSTVLLGVVNEKIVGIIDLRHRLNDWLKKNGGGNIGYAVRPSERRKGYASEMVKQALEFYKKNNIEFVEISCDYDNIASKNTILKNNGIFDRELTDSELGEKVQVYKINLRK